jgi:HSP20 family molecular chaperone IbpA
MWGEALSLLDRADRLHRMFARPAASRVAAWEPPVDVVETADVVLVQIALPGVEPASISLTLETAAIAVSAERRFPLGRDTCAGGVRIHAIEIPYGRFERRLPLPPQAATLVERRFENGCLTLLFSRKDRL